jgi:DNA helicase-2/ATP-dependent DNA helicase PcrA
LYEYLEGKTPFSTQHKTKGTEFDDVFVILDNGKWNNYNFEKLFIGGDAASANQIERTKKIFYVCCTRAKEQLAVYYYQPSAAVIAKAEEWFGKDNMEPISE